MPAQSTDDGFFRNNGLSVAFFTLGLVSIMGQAITGFSAYNSSRYESHLSPVPFAAYLGTGTFLDGIFSNWQAAVLQLGTLISLGSFLRQRGAAHSLKPKEEGGHKGDQPSDSKKSQPSRKGWLHDHSLSLAFAALFVIFLGLHAFAGARKNNEDELLRHHATIAFSQYLHCTDFYFSIFQTWEAEFFVMGLYLVLSIFLREMGSSESKSSNSGDQETGDVNE
ncbi:MAG: hypothetical protein INR62_04795 [Rhodospirillales bacterium]|nr:hypothetical protein [Acetobacter sp.]